MTIAPHPTKLLVRGGRVLDLAGDVDQPPVRDVLIEGDTITAVAPRLSDERVRDVETIDAAGKLVIPGLVNAHYHSHDVLAKGLTEDLALEWWGVITGSLGSHRRRAEVRARALAGAVECLRNGITTVQDMSSFLPMTDEVLDTILDAYAEAGAFWRPEQRLRYLLGAGPARRGHVPMVRCTGRSWRRIRWPDLVRRSRTQPEAVGRVATS